MITTTPQCHVNDQLNADYDVWNKIIYNTEVLKSNLCDYSDAYILVKGHITLAENIEAWVAFKHWAPLIKCIHLAMVYHKNPWNNKRWWQKLRFGHANV